ncbi:PLAC8 family protein [Tanacetum coccineum]
MIKTTRQQALFIGHLARDCRSKKVVESNNVTSKSEDEWDFEASFAADEEEFAFATITSYKKINYENDWIVDSGCSNHMTGDKEKLKDVSKYTGSRVVVTANNSKLPIAHVGNTIVSPLCNDTNVSLKDVFHVPGMKKNLMSVPQLTSSGQYVLFGPQDVKVYRNLEVHGDPVMMGQRMESVYVMSAETAYVNESRDERDRVESLGTCGVVNMEKHIDCRKDPSSKRRKPFRLIHSERNKSDTLAKFKEFKESAEAEIGKDVRCLCTDNGGEDTSDEFSTNLHEPKVTSLVSHVFPITATQWVSEERIGISREMSKCMLQAKNFPGQFLGRSKEEHSINVIQQAFRNKGYDGQRKGWRCFDPTTRKCYTSRDVVFDEASSWWSSNNDVLLDSGVFKEALEDSHVQLTLRDDEASDKGDPNQPQVEDALRRSTRTRKPNPKYVNAAIVETDQKEPDTFEEAFQNTEWRKAMEEELDALKRNQT